MNNTTEIPFTWGEFFLGFLVGTILLVVGTLIAFLYQLDYINNINKRLTNIENTLSNLEISNSDTEKQQELQKYCQQLEERIHYLEQQISSK